MSVNAAEGGQGFPHVVTAAAKEWFVHNPGFIIYLTETFRHRSRQLIVDNSK
jgi:hypothetical protein